WAVDSLDLRPSGIIGLLAISCAALVVMVFTLPKEPWRTVVSTIESRASPSDLVLLDAWYLTPIFDYYDRGRLARDGVFPSDLSTSLDARIRTHPSVWLIVAE